MPILFATATLFCLASSAQAQSLSTGTVTGTVLSSTGLPVERAVVTLSPIGTGNAAEGTSTQSGTFTIQLIRPGSYEVRVEALGYRPLVARVLTVVGGETRPLDLMINAAPPPVLTVDTIALALAASSRGRPGGIQLGGKEIDGLPYRFEDLASIASLATVFDRSLGAQGLPGDMTLIIADGLPFYRAPHPAARAEQLPDALFPRSSLSSVTALHNASDVEWAGSSSGYVTLATRSSTADGGPVVEGAYSGDPTWSSSQLEFDKPSLLSYQGGLRGTVDLNPRATLFLSGDALQQQTPLAPRVGATLASDLSALDPDLLSTLTDPGVETYSRFSGLARFDLQRSTTNHGFFRAAGAYSKREFDGAGPFTLARSGTPAEESFDFSTALGIESQYSRNTVGEFKAGLSGSYRDFGSTSDGVPSAYLSNSGTSLGRTPSSSGESARTDFVMVPLVRYSPGAATFKFGARIRASSHTMGHSRASLGEFLYSDPSSLLATSGYGQSTVAPKESFGTQEYGVFAQYTSRPAQGLRLTLGGRYDYELIGGDGGTQNTDWFDATGLGTDEFETGFHQFGARGSLGWDVEASGNTRLVITGSLHEGDVDPRAIYQVLAEDTEGTSTRFSGVGISWPEDGIPQLAAPALPSFTLLGPETRAPRTTNLSADLIQRVGTAFSFFVRGSVRRTDFLMRRRNLNLPLVPQALDPNGRRIFGTIDQNGTSVTTTSDDARRLTAFGEVWALDPDGWSEYTDLTAGIEHLSRRLDIFGSYTYSETLDNWVGAASGVVGATLDPGLPSAGDDDPSWSEGVSDFDIPHRLVAGATLRAGAAVFSAVYRYRSGAPFTPGYRLGVDANGDGSMRNDVAFIPDDTALGGLAEEWACLGDQSGAFAQRNSCRAEAVHTLDGKLEISMGQLGGRDARITFEAFNLLEGSGGVIDNALLLVDPNGTIDTSPDGATVTIPVTVNGGFGDILYPTSRGRMLRVGVRIGR